MMKEKEEFNYASPNIYPICIWNSYCGVDSRGDIKVMDMEGIKIAGVVCVTEDAPNEGIG